MKRVVPSSQVFHLWAHQSQSDARNGTGSVYFKGDTVYSYRDSWPLARIMKNARGETLVLTNTDKYGVTTAGHQNEANRAARHLPQVAVMHLSDAEDGHELNLAHFEKSAADLLKQAQRSMQASSVNWRRDKAQSLHEDATTYAAFFNLIAPAPFDSVPWDAALTRVVSIENPDPIRDAKRYRAREKRKVAERAKLQKRYDDYCAAVAAYDTQADAAVWRETGRWPHAPGRPYMSWKEQRKMRQVGFDLPGVRDSSGPALLRINGAEIETSQGARIPLDHAPRIWHLIEATRAAGRPYVKNGHTEHAGSFAIDEIDERGNMRAGCHQIQYGELLRMACVMGLAQPF